MFPMRICTVFLIGKFMPSSITVHIYLHSILVKYSPDGQTRRLSLDLESNSTLMDIISKLGIDLNEQHLLLAVNGKVVDLGQQLADQDNVHLMMPISGG